MQVKIKKLQINAVIPQYAISGDAGLDLTAISKNNTDKYIEYGTGLSIEIPEGYVGLIFPRSSISKYDLLLANSVPVIDSNYRGEIMLRFKKIPPYTDYYKVGERIGQLIIMPYPSIELITTDKLSSTERGEKGFGSTGKS